MELQFPDVWYTFEVDGGRYRTEKMDQQDAFQILTMQEQLWNFLFTNISAPPSPLGKSVQKIQYTLATPATLLMKPP